MRLREQETQLILFFLGSPFHFPRCFWLPATRAAMKLQDSLPTGPEVQVPILFPCWSARIFLTVENLFGFY